MFLNNKYAESVNYYKKAIKTYAKYFEAYVNLGYTLIILGKYEECIRYCNRALALNPQDASELYFIKAECFKKMKRYREALENYIKAVEIRKRVFYLIPLAILLYDMEEYDKALEIFDTLEALDLKYNDDLESIFLYKGKIMEKKGRFKEAIDYFDKALEVNPANAEIYDKKSFFFVLSGQRYG